MLFLYYLVSPVDIPIKTENPAIISSSTTPASLVVPTSILPPRTGKPLAMMAEMANKTKLASAHAAKATGMTKSLHLGKNKASNGVDDSGTHVVKPVRKFSFKRLVVCGLATMEGSQPTLGEETRLPEENPRLSVNF